MGIVEHPQVNPVPINLVSGGSIVYYCSNEVPKITLFCVYKHRFHIIFKIKTTFLFL